MKFFKSVLLLTAALAATASKEPESKVLAHIEVAPNATVDLLVTEDGMIVVAAQADPKSAKILEQALEDAEQDEDTDIVSFYKRLSGKDHVPSELTKFADRAEAMSLVADAPEDEYGPPPHDETAHYIDDFDTVVDHDNGAKEYGGDRRLGFCSGYGSCGCYTYITGNWETNTKGGTAMFSHLQPYRGSVRHSVYVWNGYWSRVISRYVSPGHLSKIRGWDTAYRSWKATVSYGTGDGFHWRFC